MLPAARNSSTTHSSFQGGHDHASVRSRDRWKLLLRTISPLIQPLRQVRLTATRPTASPILTEEKPAPEFKNNQRTYAVQEGEGAKRGLGETQNKSGIMRACIFRHSWKHPAAASGLCLPVLHISTFKAKHSPIGTAGTSFSKAETAARQLTCW